MKNIKRVAFIVRLIILLVLSVPLIHLAVKYNFSTRDDVWLASSALLLWAVRVSVKPYSHPTGCLKGGAD